MDKQQKPKLTASQSEVMKWLGKKWIAYPVYGTVFNVNGKKLCTLATLAPLERAGLIAKVDHGGYTGTEAGRALTQELGL